THVTTRTPPPSITLFPYTTLFRSLTEMYLGRLKKYDATLKFVVTLTEERALAQAKKADAEIAAGKYRGPLHGLPWGAKDLLATQDRKSTRLNSSHDQISYAVFCLK